MNRSHRALITTLTVVGASIAAIGTWAASASSATAPTYSVTVAGTDAHTLDAHAKLMFQDGGGVAVVEDPGQPISGIPYTEVGFDLPVGARVTSVSASYMACTVHGEVPQIVFGSYAPATRGTIQSATLNAPASCSPKTVTKTGAPIVTTALGRRYVLDADLKIDGNYGGPVDAIFYGATVKYTCTSPCVP